jgi:predicted metal-dependent peptidase
MERLSSSEFEEIAFELESHHAIFYKLWEMGEMVFDDVVETAAVSFDKTGKYVAFHFNKDFWNSCTPYERRFVICHECLHVWLNHGVRTNNASQPQLVNTALDVVVNHMLVDNFGFDRTQLTDEENLCWVDTVYDENENIKTGETFEHYYNSLMNSPNTKFTELRLVDSHEKLSECDVADMLKELGDGLSNEEKLEIADALKKHQTGTSNLPGNNSIGDWFKVNVISSIKKKRCWYDLIKQWASIKKEDDTTAEQWLRKNRRMTLMDTNSGSSLLLPAECDSLSHEDDKVEMWLFLDVSGSCYNLRDHFFSAALTIPENQIKVRAFSFDTQTYEVDLSTGKLRGGGGTAFHIIQETIQQELRANQKHPVIFVFTDGWGDTVNPTEPEKWHWFIDGGSFGMNQARSLSHDKCNFHNMNDFK